MRDLILGALILGGTWLILETTDWLVRRITGRHIVEWYIRAWNR